MKLILFIMLITASPNLTGQQTNYHFSYSVSTDATPENIWKVWTDVPNWTKWDPGLRQARLEGVFGQGASGELVTDKGRVSTFTIQDLVNGKAYTMKIKIPLGWLLIHRYMEQKDNTLLFTHEVRFTGPLKKLMGKTTGKRYRQMLPVAMEMLNRIAQTTN